MKKSIIKFLKKLFFFFPSKLPSGVSQFEEFAKSIIDTYDLPDNDSFRWIVAYQLQHFDRAKDYKWMQFIFGNAYCAKRRIYLEIRGAESRQTAGSMFVMIKEKQQQDAAKAANASNPIEVTKAAPALTVVPSGTQST